ncbi:MAG: S1 RNA-binding domain-containing protein [Oscillospiraceae bacterium]|nr:S1 RNA-binding domain-containing protein [Oscillospiraceae bacterium]
MQLEIGKVYEGKVKGITNYGAFVEVPVEGGKPVTGMVHISEVANTYVSDIHEFLTEGQSVQVKVLSVNEQGKISMSVKKAAPESASAPQQQRPRTPRRQDNGGKGSVWEPKPQKPQSEMTFEDMMSRFKQHSEERISDIKRNTDRKNKSRRRPK